MVFWLDDERPDEQRVEKSAARYRFELEACGEGKKKAEGEG
jgi:hypothetical protein